MTKASFEDRLIVARVMLGLQTPEIGTSLRDQVQAATDEVTDKLMAFGMLNAVRQPERNWRARLVEPTSEQTAWVLAAILGCHRACAHLFKSGPQPVYVILSRYFQGCQGCAARELDRPAPAEDADRCDICGARGISQFAPFNLAMGIGLVMGDACQGCATLLRHRAAPPRAR